MVATMKPAEALAAQLSTVLDASSLLYGDKVQALSLARQALPRPSDSTEEWRRKRAQQGVVGTGKKSDAMREQLKSKASRK